MGMTSSPLGYNSPSVQFNPLSYAPMTPGVVPSPFNPVTPGGGIGISGLSDSVEWQAVDLECRIGAMEHKDKGLVGQKCIIAGVSVSCFFVKWLINPGYLLVY